MPVSESIFGNDGFAVFQLRNSFWGPFGGHPFKDTIGSAGTFALATRGSEAVTRRRNSFNK
jgi:hypothetical protein